jgi:hypothetical protein
LFEEVWDKACTAGFGLLDVARGKSSISCSEIHDSLRNLLEETRALLFSTDQMKSESVLADRGFEQEKRTMIRRIVSEIIVNNRAEIQQKLPVPPDDRNDEVVETVILRAAAPPEPLIAQKLSMDAAETVIIPTSIKVLERTLELTSTGEEELMETVVLSSRRFTLQAQEEAALQHPLPAQPAVVKQAPAQPSQEQDELSETVMISSPNAKHRHGVLR